MNERQLVWCLTVGGVLAIAFGVGLTYTEWEFRRTAIHTTGLITVTPDKRWLLRFTAGDREFEVPLERYDDYITSRTVGSRFRILCDPEQPTTLESVENNQAGIWGGILAVTVGSIFTLLGTHSLRYLWRSSVRIATSSGKKPTRQGSPNERHENSH